MGLKKKLELAKLQYEKCMTRQVFSAPLQKINEQYILIDMKVRNMQNATMNCLENNKSRFVEKAAKLDALSPLKTLIRGYTITTKDDGEIVLSSKDLKSKDKINVRFYDGNVEAEIV